MRLAKTSVAWFASRVLTTGLGFLATVYAARVLGAGVLGQFALFFSVVYVGNLLMGIGVGGAAIKRISEGVNRNQMFTAYFLMKIAFYLVTAVLIIVFRNYLTEYIGVEWAVPALLLAFFLNLLRGITSSALKGEEKVHKIATNNVAQEAVRVGSWFVLIYIGFKLEGLVAGMFLGFSVFILLSIWQSELSFALPSKKHFRSIYDYAKFSWLGSIKGKTYSWTDTVVLGVFVSSSFVGVYEAAWRTSSIFVFVSSAIGTTVFPTVSRLSSNGDDGEVRRIAEKGLVYTSIIVLPGLVGAAILGPQVMEVFGEEFAKGGLILAILLLGRLFECYENMFKTVLNGVNRPDLAFRVNAVFIGLNLLFNVALVKMYGWTGAAVATAASMAIATVLSWRYIRAVIDFRFPWRGLATQAVSAAAMAAPVYMATQIYSPLNVLQTLATVSIGGAVYFAVLLTLDTDVREKLFATAREILNDLVKEHL